MPAQTEIKKTKMDVIVVTDGRQNRPGVALQQTEFLKGKNGKTLELGIPSKDLTVVAPDIAGPEMGKIDNINFQAKAEETHPVTLELYQVTSLQTPSNVRRATILCSIGNNCSGQNC